MSERTDTVPERSDTAAPAGTEAAVTAVPEAVTAVPEAAVAEPGPVTAVPAGEAAAPQAEAVPPVAPAATRGSARRVLWAVARWTAAVVVCGGLGAGTAIGITSMERTDVPGLETEHDGRWEYPKLSLPALPQGSPRPFSEGNEGEVHHADPRALLLPAPAGATVDPRSNGGWVSVDQYLATYQKDYRTELRQTLADSALRHVAARAWTTPDGTTTRVHLLRFASVAYAEAFKDDVGSVDGPALEGVGNVRMDTSLMGVISVQYTARYAFVEEPADTEQTRWAYVQAGDTVALITQTRKGEALTVPFQQTVALQNQLLG
ncbi:hypothetical protein [Streptomyces sp. NPDC008121]|uniref:hypothetical protein n=1 Tax=Streptomyces sp. NPDC008121 TaxID=3364809 RepID=UPI0036E098E1